MFFTPKASSKSWLLQTQPSSKILTNLVGKLSAWGLRRHRSSILCTFEGCWRRLGERSLLYF